GGSWGIWTWLDRRQLLLPPGQELLAVDEEDAALATPQLAHARHLPTCRPALPVPCTESSQSGNLGYPHIPIVHSVTHQHAPQCITPAVQPRAKAIAATIVTNVLRAIV